jgi:hypothetical protein
MTPILPRMTPPAARSEVLADAGPDAGVSAQDVVIVPPPGHSAPRVRPSADTLVERLREMQMQDWS